MNNLTVNEFSHFSFTVLSIELRRNCLDLILKQNLSKGLSHALQRALNDSTAYAQVSASDRFSYSNHRLVASKPVSRK